MKKLYKVISILLCTMIVGISAACNGSANASVNAEGEEYHYDPYPPGTFESQDEEDFNLWMRKTDLEHEAAFRHVCMLRNGECIGLDWEVYLDEEKKKYDYTDCGAYWNRNFLLYGNNLGGGQYVESFGDVTVPTLRKSDLVIGFAKPGEKTKDISLKRLEFYGYSVPCTLMPNLLMIVDPETHEYVDTVAENGSRFDYVELVDSTKKEVEDYYNLNKDEYYYVRYGFKGSIPAEVELKANCNVYKEVSETIIIKGKKVEKENAIDFTLPGYTDLELGYAEYDLSGLEPGLYVIERSVINIK